MRPLLRSPLLLAPTLLLLACETPFGRPVDLRPTAQPVRAGHEVEVAAGTAVRFLEVDGTGVETSRLILAPGRHTIGYRVRRPLHSVDEMLTNVFHIGECELELNALAGFDYRVRYAGRQESGRGPDRSGARVQNFTTQMVLENTVTGDLEPLACALSFDCRRLRDGVRHSRYCSLN